MSTNLSLVPPSHGSAVAVWFGQINHGGNSLFTVYDTTRQEVVDRLRRWIKAQSAIVPGSGYLVIIRRESLPPQQEPSDGPQHT